MTTEQLEARRRNLTSRLARVHPGSPAAEHLRGELNQVNDELERKARDLPKRWTYTDTPRDLWENHAHSTMPSGAIRWDVSRNLVPQDIVEAWEAEGFPVDVEAQREAHARTLEEIRANARAQDPHPDLVADARAAHGPGVTLVNVLTGRTFTT